MRAIKDSRSRVEGHVIQFRMNQVNFCCSQGKGARRMEIWEKQKGSIRDLCRHLECACSILQFRLRRAVSITMASGLSLLTNRGRVKSKQT